METLDTRREIPDTRDDIQTRDFCRAIRDEDSFTIVYELAFSSTPIAVEDLAKTFGASVSYLNEILSRLQRLTVVQKTGKRWAISTWAKEKIDFLEEATKNVNPELPKTPSSSVVVEWGTTEGLEAGTYNGLWSASTSHITANDRRAGAVMNAGTADSSVELAAKMPARAQNEARSHDYK